MTDKTHPDPFALNEALRVSEAKFKVVVDNSNDGILFCDVNGIISYRSPADFRINGYADAERLGKIAFDLVHPDDSLAVRDAWQKAIRHGGLPVKIEHKVMHKNGTVLQISSTIQNLLENPAIRSMIVTMRDITDHKRAEIQLQKSEEKFRSYIEHAPDVVLIVDESGKFLEINDSGCQKLGYSKDEIGKMSIRDVLAEESQEEGLTHFKKVIAEGAAKSELWHVRNDGSKSCMLVDAVKLSETRVMGFLKDITEQKRINELYRSQFENSPDIILIIDREYKIEAINRGFGNSTTEDLKGRDAIEILPPESRNDAREAVDRCFRTLEIIEFEHRISKGRWVRARIIPMHAYGTIFRVMIISSDITERKLAENTLRESEEKYRTLVDNANEAIIVVQDGMLKFFNRKTTKLTGYSEQELLAKPFIEFIFPDDRAKIIENYANRLQGKVVPLIYDVRVQFVDESIRWVEINAIIIDWQGNPATLTFITDITERKQAEAALLKSEARYRTLFESSRDALMTLSPPEWNFTSCNNATLTMFGINDIAEFSSFGPWALSPENQPDGRASNEKARVMIDTAMRTGAHFFEWEHRRKDGTVFPATVLLTKAHTSGGDILQATVRDISEQKQAELALRESENKFRAIFENSRDALGVSKNGRHVFSNPAYLNLFGFKNDKQLVGTSILDRIAPSHRPKIIQNIQQRAAGMPVPSNYESLGLRLDGTEFDMDLNVATFELNGETLTVGIIRDISERKRMEAELQKAQKLDALGVLAGGIAHDFNNLLGGVFGYIDMAKESCDSGSKTSDYLEKALNIFSRAKDLTQQLLTFAKGGSPIRKTGSLAPILKESTQFALSGSSVAASFRIAKDLWFCDFDENQFGQIVDNLVINAIQAMPLGGKISVSAENLQVSQGEKPPLKPGKYVHVSFADTGIGIPQSILSRIFDPFFTTKQKGNGLGLATVYSIIHKHDGEITVESEQDKGTTFHLYMPVSEKSTVSQTAKKVHSHKGAGRILIMDDEDYIREIAGDMLKSMGYEVEYAFHGDEALKMIHNATQKKHPFAAAIMDLTIPGGKGGKETIKQLRKKNKNLLVFVSSGYSEDPVMADPSGYGFTDRIVKPFRKAELAEMLGRHVKVKK
jgi:PAS domain S-box-containing protein